MDTEKFEVEGDSYQGSEYGQFSEISDSIENNIYRINADLVRLQKLSDLVGTEKDTEDLRASIHSLQVSANDTLLRTKTLVKTLLKLAKSAPRSNVLLADRLHGVYKSTLNEYREFQDTLVPRLKSYIPIKTSSKLIDLEESAGQSPPESALEQMGAGLKDTAEFMENLLERHQRIAEIEADVIDVDEIMKDIAAIVNQQSETVAAIESNFDNANRNTDSAAEHLIRASSRQRTYIRRKFCLLLLFVVIVGIVAVILVLTLHK